MTPSPDLFSWLREHHPLMGMADILVLDHLWPFVLDVVEAADRLSENAGAGIPWPKVERLRDSLAAFYEAAGKVRP